MLAVALLAATAGCQWVAPLPANSSLTDGSAGADGAPLTDPRLCLGPNIGGPDWATWPIPNPPSASGLPNAQAYDTTDPDVAIDLVTELRWRRAVLPGTYTWRDAWSACTALGPGWRMPTRIELAALVDTGNRFINPDAFPAAAAAPTWTSSVLAGNQFSAWAVDFSRGATTWIDKCQEASVRCVNGAGALPDGGQHYVVSGNVVRDQGTGLTWQRTISDAAIPFADAVALCAGLGGGWRLPSLNELQSLMDDTRMLPAIDVDAFPKTPDDLFWAEPILDPAASPVRAYFVSFSNGNADLDVVTFSRLVRCVR